MLTLQVFGAGCFVMGNWLNVDKVAHYWNRGKIFLGEKMARCVTHLMFQVVKM